MPKCSSRRSVNSEEASFASCTRRALSALLVFIVGGFVKEIGKIETRREQVNFLPTGIDRKSLSMQLFAIKITEERITRGRETRKMLKWPRKPTTQMCKQREKKREKVNRIDPGDRRLVI